MRREKSRTYLLDYIPVRVGVRPLHFACVRVCANRRAPVCRRRSVHSLKTRTARCAKLYYYYYRYVYTLPLGDATLSQEYKCVLCVPPYTGGGSSYAYYYYFTIIISEMHSRQTTRLTIKKNVLFTYFYTPRV